MKVRLQLELPADAAMLARTRWALHGYMEELGASEETTGDVILALDEACANVVRHAFPEGEGSFRLTAHLSPSEILMEVEDDGVGFNPFEVTALGVEPEATSGRGLRIIRQVMTSVDVESPMPHGGTRLRMRKDLTGLTAASPSGADPVTRSIATTIDLTASTG
jgi:anti-sigma regulatory factor (Ser/Thr protein kinase)